MPRPPLIKGGQGRSAQDLTDSCGAMVFFSVLVLVALMALAVMR